MIKGYRNLLFLGAGTLAIAITTSGIALTIYHHTGDIYLDRSRPGFLPEKSERPDHPSSDYKMTDSTPLTPENLQTFLTEYQQELKKLENLNPTFSPDPLSSSSLALPDSSAAEQH